MSIRVAVRHRTSYQYDRPVQLSPHLVRLRPAAHCRTPVLAYSLNVTPKKHFVNWQQDPFGNFVARFVFPEKVSHFSVDVELIAELTVINPFDFFVEEYAETWPFEYDEDLLQQLQPYLKIREDGSRLREWVRGVKREKTAVVNFLVELNRRLQQEIGYIVRMETGVQSCEETLTKLTGSCRDSAWLLVQILRHLGLAARFVSGYLVQLVADVKSLDGPSGTDKDFTDLHAWVEVFVPGAGWIGLDPTSGLFAGEGHIPLSCTPEPAAAAPVSGLVEPCETTFSFENSVERIHEDARVTKPYSEEQWQAVLALGDKVDEDIQADDIRLTQGGEPTFVSIDDMDSAQWNTAALGEAKEKLARSLLQRLSRRFASGGLLHHGQGKWYPGEPLPRWAYSCFFRSDDEPLWHAPELLSPVESPRFNIGDARRFIQTLARKLAVNERGITAAYEDVVHYLRSESSLPVDVDPRKANLKDPMERRRLAKVLSDGLDEISGYVLPLQWVAAKERWHSAPWTFRRERLVLLPGDSPMGFRLPLDSIALDKARKHEQPPRDTFEERNPLVSASEIARRYSLFDTTVASTQPISEQSPTEDNEDIPRTALCVQPRDGRLWVFLPPVSHLENWIELIAAIEATAKECELAIDIEGYEPPADARIRKLAVTPDPGVIEVNIHPSRDWRDLVSNTETLYEEARQTRLGSEKFMLDGRHIGTGGGNHVTFGAQRASDSPFLRRPDLLASLILYWQHHPALSYLFSGLFIGPTSQAPRIDEARNDALYELEIALQQVVPGESTEPWLVDRLFRNLLVDITGNTHRAEFCIDKLYNPAGPAGRQGLLEFRGFEMPPHWRMSVVQMLLLRALIATFWRNPYHGRPARWGTALHDRFMLPFYVKQDFRQVLDDLAQAGYSFDAEWFEPFFEFRFPHFGEIHVQTMHFELRGAIEPWNVLGEEVTSQGTARFVDSSVERVQLSLRNFNPERYALCCNGRRVPLQSTDVTGEYVGGVRFKAWQPVFGLHPRLPTDAPLRFDIVDLANRKSIGGCTYHVAHPSGRNYETLPVNAYEAEARRISRFWSHGHTTGTLSVREERANPNFPCTLDLRFRPVD
ncbi:MAG: transglutaminase family protein [Gammaproteobacteria bacterium]|nr:transglutaminase family protein [Gammaproteobacteria bacterium]